MPVKHILAAAGVAAVLGVVQSANAGETIRIEPRPFYGATVTLEEGVRVYRPLPADRRVIINPGHRTPVSLGFEDNRTVSHNYNYNEHSNDNGRDDSDSGYGGYGGGSYGGLPMLDGKGRAGNRGERRNAYVPHFRQDSVKGPKLIRTQKPPRHKPRKH